MLELPLRQFMTTPVETIGATATLAHAREIMTKRRISALPVMDARRRVSGVITRTDLLRAGREAGTDEAALVFDGRQVVEAATAHLFTVESGASLAAAARHFLDQHIHRVFVEKDGELVGVLSGRDLLEAVTAASLAMSISSVMSSPLHTVHARTALSEAIDLLLADGVSSLVVYERDHHIGMFSRSDALESGHERADIAVGRVMRTGGLVLPASTSIGDAAAKAIELHLRQILVEDDGSLRRTDPPDLSRSRKLGGVLGIVTSTDLAGAVLLASG